MRNMKSFFYDRLLSKKSFLCCILALSVTSLWAKQATKMSPPRVNQVEETQKKQIQVTGTVLDAKGQAVIGASIVVVGTSNGVITDFDGRFTIQMSNAADLKISYMGYNPKVIHVTESKQITIVLEEDNKVLDEVVVVGYGKMKKDDLSASIASVENMDKLQKRPVTNMGQLLQGQVAGVSVVSNGGHLGNEPTITIRGMGSPNGEKPLYVVDGVPGATFNLSDVESITILKDAASAAIYGAYAGSAGVVLVTTKQAEEGKTSVSYNGVFGVSTATNLPQSLTWEDQYKVRKAAYTAEGQNLPIGWDRINGDPIYGRTNTNWIDEIFRSAVIQRHNFSVSGGTGDFSNRLSLEYTDREGTLVGTYSKNFVARLNSKWKISKYIRVREDLTWRDFQVRDVNTNSAESGPITSALKMPRNVFPYYADGSFGGTVPLTADYISQYGQNYADIHGDCTSPLRTLLGPQTENHRSTFTASTFLDIIEPIKGLNFTSRFTYKQTNYFDRYYRTRQPEPGKPNLDNKVSYESYREPQWDWENTITYDRIFGAHNLGLMASTTATEYQYRFFNTTGHDFTNESPEMMYFSQAGYFENSSDAYYKDRNFSMVARASYSYANRYFMTASIRRDYAGRLPEGKKYGDFPSLTAAWKITSEKWMPKMKGLNMLKIRASWGKIGNLSSIAYGYGTPVLSNRIFGGGDVGGQVGMDSPIAYGTYLKSGFNPNLTWETSEQVNIGLDALFFENRLSVTADFFDKNTNGLIKRQDTGWPSTIGIRPMLVNDGTVNNRGFELGVNWNDKLNNDFSYYIAGNLSTLRNRVTNIGQASATGEKPIWTSGGSYKDLEPFRTEEGTSLYSFYLIQNDGVFMTDEEAENYVDKNGNRIQPNAKAGDLKFIDKDGNGSIGNEDKVFMGNAMPKLTYALNAGFTWKKLTFNMMLQGVSGVKLFNAYKFSTLNESQGSFNRSDEILKALNGPNPDVPRISLSDPNNNFGTESSYYLEDGDYLRIKNISLTYSLTDLVRRINFLGNRNVNCDLTLSCDNLMTITNYSGIDPEVGGVGLDTGQYPVARTFSVGLKLNF